MPAPPMPAIQKRLPSRGERNELLRNLVRGVGTREPKHRRRHVAEPARVVEQRANQLRRATELALGHDDRSAASFEVASVLRLVVSGREQTGDEDRGLPGGGKLPDGAPGAREREIACTKRRAELLREREQAVIGPSHTAPEPLEGARSRHMGGS